MSQPKGYDLTTVQCPKMGNSPLMHLSLDNATLVMAYEVNLIATIIN